METDINLIRAYIDIHSTDKLIQTIIDPTHLRKELLTDTQTTICKTIITWRSIQ